MWWWWSSFESPGGGALWSTINNRATRFQRLGCAQEYAGAVQRQSGMKEVGTHQVEFAVRKGLRQVVLLEVDPVQHAARLGCRTRALQRGIRDVHCDDIPATLRQPHRVRSLAAAEVQRPTDRQSGNHLGEADD